MVRIAICIQLLETGLHSAKALLEYFVLLGLWKLDFTETFTVFLYHQEFGLKSCMSKLISCVLSM